MVRPRSSSDAADVLSSAWRPAEYEGFSRLAALTRRRLERAINRRAGTETGLRMGGSELAEQRNPAEAETPLFTA
jgi:hypothetical protein